MKKFLLGVLIVSAAGSFIGCRGGLSGGLCSNSCQFAFDGTCDDGGSGSSYSVCTIGTDCADCGSR